MVFVFLADGFEEIEALAVVDILRRANLDVRTVGVGTKTPRGTHGIPVTADIAETDFFAEDMTALVLPGGMPGTTNLESSSTVQRALVCAMEQDIPVGAICAAPSILGHAGYLQKKNATCFPGFENSLQGATLSDEGVVTDGNITTGKGAGIAIDFALRLVSILVDEQTANTIRSAMQCQ